MIAAGVFTLAVVLIVAGAVIAHRWLARLMDDGDGQGGVPPLSRRARKRAALGGYVAARQAAARDPLDGIVVNAEFERIAARLHYDSVRDMLDGGDDAA